MEKVLELRCNEEKAKTEEFVKTNDLFLKEQEQLKSLNEEFKRKNENKTNNVHEMKMQFLYVEKLKRQLHIQSRKVDEMSKKLDEAKENLIKARSDRKIMEKLKEKDKDKFYAEQCYKEQKELDDISTMKYAK